MFDVFPSIDSTQEEARRRLQRGGFDQRPLWILAHEQTHGRGRLGERTWSSVLGNFHGTLILPRTQTMEQSMASHFANGTHASWQSLGCHAVTAALLHFAPHLPFVHKPPNDVVIKGQKIAGVLVEMEPEAILMGMGVNLAVAPENLGERHNLAATSFLQQHKDSCPSVLEFAHILHAQVMGALPAIFKVEDPTIDIHSFT